MEYRLVHLPVYWICIGTLCILAPDPAVAIPLTWIGGSGTWSDGGSAALWTPADEPDADDEAVFHTSGTVSLGTSNTIQALTMSNGISLLTNGFNLSVDGSIQLSNSNTQLLIGGGSSTLNADRIILNSGAILSIAGGTIVIDQEVGNGLIDLNTGATLVGTGTINLTDILGTTSTLIVNDGTITARSEPSIPFAAPPSGLLLINASSPNTRINLDGTSSGGVVNAHQNQTLRINGTLSDSFGGKMNLFHNATVHISTPWELNAGSILATTGFVPASGLAPAIPADVAYFAGGTLTQTGGVITVEDTDGALQLNAPFIQTGGSINTNGRVIINSTSRFGSSAVVAGTGSLMISSAGTLVVDNGGSIAVGVRNEGILNLAGSLTVGEITVKNFAQSATGKLVMQLGGAGLGDSDRLIVEGEAIFAGQLRIGRLNALTIKPGDTFAPVAYLSHSGSFSLINDTGIAGLSFLGDYGSNSLTLIATALYPGDADLNGRVNLFDLVALAAHWQSSADWFGGDFDGNGFVNSNDLGILAMSWQAGTTGQAFDDAAASVGLPATSIPEPFGLLPAFVSLLSLPRFRHR